jgi:hypothetical protein
MTPTEQTKNAIKQALADTDWSQLPDVKISNKDEFVNYRSSLRFFLTDAPAGYTPPPLPEPVWTETTSSVVNANNETVEGMQNL